MVSFKQFFEQIQSVETIAVLPGGFKPPTKGHFQALENMLRNAEKGIVFVGKSPRDGITQEMAYQIWCVYKPYLSKPVEIIKSDVTPVKSTYDLADQFRNVNLVVGAGNKNEDIKRYSWFTKHAEEYPHVIISQIDIQGGGINGTEVRKRIAEKDPHVVDYFTPKILSATDKERIKSILGIA